MNRRLSAFLQFIIGFFLGIVILAGGTAALGYVFLSRMTTSPSKPLFGDEKKEEPSTKTAQATKSAVESATKEKPAPKPKEEATAKTETPTEEPEEKLPPGAYKARVTWNQGLSVRAEPSADAARVGGVGYNQKLVILSYSNDKQWQKIQLPGGGEGWIKAGNVEKAE